MWQLCPIILQNLPWYQQQSSLMHCLHWLMRGILFIAFIPLSAHCLALYGCLVISQCSAKCSSIRGCFLLAISKQLKQFEYYSFLSQITANPITAYRHYGSNCSTLLNTRSAIQQWAKWKQQWAIATLALSGRSLCILKHSLSQSMHFQYILLAQWIWAISKWQPHLMNCSYRSSTSSDSLRASYIAQLSSPSQKWKQALRSVFLGVGPKRQTTCRNTSNAFYLNTRECSQSQVDYLAINNDANPQQVSSSICFYCCVCMVLAGNMPVTIFRKTMQACLGVALQTQSPICLSQQRVKSWAVVRSNAISSTDTFSARYLWVLMKRQYLCDSIDIGCNYCSPFKLCSQFYKEGHIIIERAHHRT